MTNRIEEQIDHRFGFPVVLRDMPVKELRGELVVDVNADDLRWAVLAALATKRGCLTGSEIYMIRHSRSQTLTAFGEECGVSHVAVMKWEAQGQKPTRMIRGTEFLIRRLVLRAVPLHIVWARAINNLIDVVLNTDLYTNRPIEISIHHIGPPSGAYDRCSNRTHYHLVRVSDQKVVETWKAKPDDGWITPADRSPAESTLGETTLPSSSPRQT